MKICFIGDCDYNTGPSNVNKSYKKHLKNKMRFLRYRNKALRSFETVYSVLLTNVTIISGMSYINQLALYTAKLFKKTIIYLMHGSYSYECILNDSPKSKKNEENEKAMYKYADKIILVSEQYMKWFKGYMPEYSDKVTYINNGIDWKNTVIHNNEKNHRNPYMLIAMGGGRPLKNNKTVCQAVKLLNEKYHMPFEFMVLGRDYEDTDTIKNSEYTKYLGQLEREQVNEWLAKANICIQNSSIESFGLASIEALCSGCNLVISKNVGSISILSNISENEIVQDVNNPEEIAKRIIYVYNHPNNDRLLKGIDVKKTSCEYASNKLLKIAEKEFFKKGNKK